MDLYPIQVNLQDRRCVVIGAGTVAERKVRALLRAGAAVRLVAPEATLGLQRLAAEGMVTWARTLYSAPHLDGAYLVFAATDQPEVNAAVARDADARRILVCRTDEQALGSFVSAASVARGDLLLTISTGGGSPTLTAVLRERLEAEYGPEWAEMTALLRALRPNVQQGADETARKEAVRRVLEEARVWDALRAGQFGEAEARARECLCMLSA